MARLKSDIKKWNAVIDKAGIAEVRAIRALTREPSR